MENDNKTYKGNALVKDMLAQAQAEYISPRQRTDDGYNAPDPAGEFFEASQPVPCSKDNGTYCKYPQGILRFPRDPLARRNEIIRYFRQRRNSQEYKRILQLHTPCLKMFDEQPCCYRQGHP